jgi:hypothetical protein
MHTILHIALEIGGPDLVAILSQQRVLPSWKIRRPEGLTGLARAGILPIR